MSLLLQRLDKHMKEMHTITQFDILSNWCNYYIGVHSLIYVYIRLLMEQIISTPECGIDLLYTKSTKE